MDPNNTNPSNTPPANDVPPVQPPAPEAPVTPEQPVTPVEPATPAPVEPEAPAQPEVASPFAAASPAPEAAPASVFSAAAAGAPQAPKQPKNKKIILIAAIAGGAVLLAIIGFVVFSLLTTVSKEDYRDAARQFNQVSLASSSLTSDSRSLGSATGSSSDTTFEESVSEAEASVAKLNEENKALSELKAVRVGEGAKLYSTFNDKLKAYTAYATELIASVKALRPAMVICNNVSDAEDVAGRVAALKACSTALSDVKDIPNEQMNTYVVAIAKGYGEYAVVYEKTSALTNPFGAQYEEYKALRDQMNAAQDTISDASDTFSDALKARDAELSVKESADTLADYLTDQQK